MVGGKRFISTHFQILILSIPDNLKSRSLSEYDGNADHGCCLNKSGDEEIYKFQSWYA